MASEKPIVLVTGGNGGIGYELASQLMADDKHVLLGSRSAEKGEKAVKQLQSMNHPGSVELLVLDVNSPDSITAAAKQVASTHGRLDALVNNAAVAMFPDGTPIHEQMEQAFRTNAIGPLLMVDAFAPLLEKSTTTPRILNVSSGAGSIGRRLESNSPMYTMQHTQYRSTKAALNMVSSNQAVQYGEKGWKVFAFCPGWTVSNLSAMNGPDSGAKLTSEGARPMVDILNGKRDDEHAGFLNADGQFPW